MGFMWLGHGVGGSSMVKVGGLEKVLTTLMVGVVLQ